MIRRALTAKTEYDSIATLNLRSRYRRAEQSNLKPPRGGTSYGQNRYSRGSTYTDNSSGTDESSLLSCNLEGYGSPAISYKYNGCDCFNQVRASSDASDCRQKAPSGYNKAGRSDCRQKAPSGYNKAGRCLLCIGRRIEKNK